MVNKERMMFNKILGFIKNNKRLKTLKIKKIETFQQKEAEFLPATLEIIEYPPSYASRIVLWTLWLLGIFVLLWVIFGSVDEVAVAPGKVIPDGYVRTLQAEDQGIIKNIYVTEGQKVEKGQVLMELDTTVSAADLAKLKQQQIDAQLELDRLTAEKENRPFIPQVSEEREKKDADLQMAMYESRKGEYSTKIESAQQQVLQYQSALNNAQIEKQKLIQTYSIEKKKESALQSLVDQNSIAMVTLLDQQSKCTTIEHNIAEQDATISQQEALLAKYQADLMNVAAARKLDIDTNLQQAQQTLFTCQEEIKKAEKKNGLEEIIAPEDGYVSNLSVHTIGGIVTPAEILLEVVPATVPLKIEAWVENKDIGFIEVGQAAELKVETFNFQKYGTIHATVANISPNATESSDKGSLYRVFLTMDQDYMAVNGQNVQLGSGMSVSAEIKTRRKHIYEFFLEPFKKYQSEFLRER
jgi:hemolysin D